MPEVPEDTSKRVEIFIWENKSKEDKRRYTIFEEINKKTYSLLIQHCTPELEGKLKVMNTYDVIETDQHGIDLAKLIWNICHLQDDDKQDIMAAVEIDNQVYLLYQALYQ